jgi:hypothetical protein
MPEPIHRSVDSRGSGRSGPREEAESPLIVKALDEMTWPDFARLVEKHNGV